MTMETDYSQSFLRQPARRTMWRKLRSRMMTRPTKSSSALEAACRESSLRSEWMDSFCETFGHGLPVLRGELGGKVDHSSNGSTATVVLRAGGRAHGSHERFEARLESAYSASALQAHLRFQPVGRSGTRQRTDPNHIKEI
jgi:hypothetical protein